MVQVFQLLELPAETQKMETYQALLVTRRALLLHTITNMSESLSAEDQDNLTQFKQVSGHSVSSEGEGDCAWSRRCPPPSPSTRRCAARRPRPGWTW